MARKPIVAGQFYQGDSSNLNKQLKECFLSEFGPGKLPCKGNKKTIGVISPHAGYLFSGPCAAFSFKEIAESKVPDVYILLGLSHNGSRSCLSLEDWQTPLGIVKTDKEFQNSLSLPVDEEAHAYEHSIEVQLPFLQFVNKEKEFRIAPIITSPDIKAEQLASLIFEAVKKTKRKVMIIASSDFTHYGYNYGYVPFRDNIKENMQKLDMGAIEKIKKLNTLSFLDYTEKTGATICGKYPIAVLIELSKKLGAKKAELLKYYTSGDILGDYSNAVGYASIKIN